MSQRAELRETGMNVTIEGTDYEPSWNLCKVAPKLGIIPCRSNQKISAGD